MSMEVREKMDMERLVQLAEEKQYRQLKEALLEFPAVDVAAFMEELDSERTVIVFRMLPKDLAMDVFAELPVENQQHIINSITDQELSEIMEELYVDDAVDMVEELPAAVGGRGLKSTTPDTRELINQFLNYPENSAGSIKAGEEEKDQCSSPVSRGQRGQHYDGRVCGLEKDHDRRGVLCVYPEARGGFGNDLYLLRDG